MFRCKFAQGAARIRPAASSVWIRVCCSGLRVTPIECLEVVWFCLGCKSRIDLAVRGVMA